LILGLFDCSVRRTQPRSDFVAWISNRDAWIDELQLRAGSPVRLENGDEPFGVEVLTDAPGIIVAALSWRDPSFFEPLAKV
jgi:hypothetical protein